MIRIDELKWDDDGLIPAVIQDVSTGEILTLAYVSRESLAKTRELGETVFFSRARRRLWHKGETSGNRQRIVSVMTDCDRDALVIQVQPQGPACHTGARSCFFETVEGFAADDYSSMGSILGELETVLKQRKASRPEGSYTARLFDLGIDRILQKVGEEAIETIVAGMSRSREETIREAADLFFHVMVALQEMDISLEEIASELQSRRK
jgi:phosphoribosyl-ATP pyrophosphohydrolase/phosphoribosyl-AMP cyclohydrolase